MRGQATPVAVLDGDGRRPAAGRVLGDTGLGLGADERLAPAVEAPELIHVAPRRQVAQRIHELLLPRHHPDDDRAGANRRIMRWTVAVPEQRDRGVVGLAGEPVASEGLASQRIAGRPVSVRVLRLRGCDEDGCGEPEGARTRSCSPGSRRGRLHGGRRTRSRRPRPARAHPSAAHPCPSRGSTHSRNRARVRSPAAGRADRQRHTRGRERLRSPVPNRAISSIAMSTRRRRERPCGRSRSG